MQKSFNANLAKSVSNPQAPLAPLNLLRAGVPAREVVWFRRLRPDRQMAALTTTRGKLLLEKVREFATNQTGAAVQALPA
jgi:hypothetical protein